MTDNECLHDSLPMLPEQDEEGHRLQNPHWVRCDDCGELVEVRRV